MEPHLSARVGIHQAPIPICRRVPNNHNPVICLRPACRSQHRRYYIGCSCFSNHQWGQPGGQVQIDVSSLAHQVFKPVWTILRQLVCGRSVHSVTTGKNAQHKTSFPIIFADFAPASLVEPGTPALLTDSFVQFHCDTVCSNLYRQYSGTSLTLTGASSNSPDE